MNTLLEQELANARPLAPSTHLDHRIRNLFQRAPKRRPIPIAIAGAALAAAAIAILVAFPRQPEPELTPPPASEPTVIAYYLTHDDGRLNAFLNPEPEPAGFQATTVKLYVIEYAPPLHQALNQENSQ